MRYKIISFGKIVQIFESDIPPPQLDDPMNALTTVNQIAIAADTDEVWNAWYITKLAFRNRFTLDEKVTLYTAAKTEVQIQVYIDDINAAKYIDLKLPETIAGVQSLETSGIIAAGRANTILTTATTADERAF